MFNLQAAITLITVFVVFQIPCYGPLEWLTVLTLFQGKTNKANHKHPMNMLFLSQKAVYSQSEACQRAYQNLLSRPCPKPRRACFCFINFKCWLYQTIYKMKSHSLTVKSVGLDLAPVA